MKTHVTPTALPGVVLVTIDAFRDERGFFLESWHKRHFAEAGLDLEFVQEGHSRSRRNVLRGLHYQNSSAPMGKLLRCTVGAVYDVVVDICSTAPTCGQWLAVELSAENMTQIYVPPGFAHVFLALSDVAEVQYKQTGFHEPQAEGTIRWDDPALNISWPVGEPVLSMRDHNGQSFDEYLKKPAF